MIWPIYENLDPQKTVMSKIQFLIFSSLLVFGCQASSGSNNENLSVQPIVTNVPPPPEEEGNKMEMVFCLDATGSMSGLIGTAKEKIWSIVSEVAQDTTVESIKLGMVFYRDRGDDFTTRPIYLTDDLDSVYSELLAINASGGGDSPESVNQALHEAITEMQWNTNSNVYKTIFVVGDCPPHMDYQDDVLYTESCVTAAEKGIVINTIKLGDACIDAIPHFQKMAECTNGEYLHLDQNASDYTVSTPYDSEINELSREIDDSRMYYGTEDEKNYNYTKKDKALKLYDEGSVTANSDRSTYKNSEAGKKAWMGNKELITDYNENKVDLDEISEDELPEELKNKTKEEKELILKQAQADREANQQKLTELSKKRAEYIQEEKAKRGEESSFSKEVVEIMNKQAKKEK